MIGFYEMENDVKKGVLNIIKIRDEVQDILQEDYDGIYEFFLELFGKNYEYIVLMSRRCFVLCQIFMRIFIAENRIKYTATKIISDKAIPFYECENMLDDVRMVIVDDILIHGRTISKFYHLLESKCPNSSVDMAVYMEDSEVDCMADELKNRIYYKCVANKSEWRSLSNKIVATIMIANEPYTSFVASYFQYNENMLKRLRNFGNSIKMTSSMQKEYGVSAWYLEDVLSEEFPLLKSISYATGIRIYERTVISKTTIIPYVFVRSLELNQSEIVCRMVAEKLPDAMKNIKALLSMVKKDNDFVEYRMRLFTCVVSKLYWLNFKKRHSLTQTLLNDYDTLNRSFGYSVGKELGMLTYDDAERILKLTIEDIETYEPQANDELVNVLANSFETGGATKDILHKYFQQVWYKDECRAKRLEERHEGLCLEYFVDLAEKYNKSRSEIMAEMVSVWDNGLASANYMVDSESRVVSCFITPGEQSYRILIERNPYLMKNIIFLSKFIRRGMSKNTISLEEYISYRVGKMLEFINEYKEKYGLEDYEHICKLVEDTKGYLNDWNQTSILNYALKNNPVHDKCFMEDFIRKRCNME